jgi:Domain of unknown function (DUF1707)/Inner membrane component of T3SS, cytoplasmic domain
MAGNPGGSAPTGGPYAPARQQCADDRVRVSDAERDEVISQLGERFAEGRLTHDTFIHRVEAALKARDRHDLAQLLADLPAPRSVASRLLAYGQRGWAAVTGAMPGALPATAPPVLMFPSSDRRRFTIGRDAACDLVLPDPSVSRWHAGLKRCASGWMLDDLGSTNGTRLNGWRVTESVPVRPGDRVSFGAMTFVVAAPGPVGGPSTGW